MTRRIAGLALALPFVTACFSRSVTATRIVDRRDVVLDRVREPSRDQFLVAPAFPEGRLVLHVERRLACTRHVQQVLTVRDEIGGLRHPGAATTGAVLAVTGGSLLALYGATEAQDDARDPHDDNGGIGLLGLGALVTLAGVITFAVSGPCETTYSTREETRPPRGEPSACGTDAPTGSVVDLELPDGSHLAAQVDAGGDASFALPAASLPVDPLPTTVRVDGAVVQRLLIPRP